MMLRDFKFLRRNNNSGKHSEETENIPVNPRDSLASQTSSNDSLSSRPPLNTIHDPNPVPKPEGPRTRLEKTPTKPKPKHPDPTLHLRTPDKHRAGSSKYRFGRGEEEVNRGGLTNVTPRAGRGVSSGYSESNSTQSTPNKSVSKPLCSGFRSRIDNNGGGGGGRGGGGFAALYRGVPVSNGGSNTVVNAVQVPHFDLKEDPSFWMEHNVQVLIRVRPLNSMERSMFGYNRCLMQENSQSITWIGQPETRFTFDHVACETVDQEMLFRMVGLPMVENCLSGYNSCMFAYGQTGSGKTYTMLGELDNLEVNASPHRGMTPRIFEFLFARIQAEEESRRDEGLKYNCKCSFLEIYNEQIADLLDPSSTNLLLREDIKKGVYVENLSEFEVQTVSDVLNLLTQGALNRKVAATNMNRESSRSHSVFTCEIESRWEKDSTTNLRFARLNLVDLAGSERQKSSGAEGERLKEAANINKSLSTLGHVIMILVDIAQGKQRHVPYRDSRLTFLLQDSLGGNSKTMIIANVSPSICCAAETLNTLKFAQRAKLIQNNAVVNEDSTGDVIALQHQIQLLKEELAVLKRQNVFRSLSFDSTVSGKHIKEEDDACTGTGHDLDQRQVDDLLGFESKGIVRLSTKQLKSLETTLAGALRREQMAETSIKELEAEIEQLNRLVRQREEDTRSTKMMLRFREDKIQRMESLIGGSLPPDTYLMEENKALAEEIQSLQAKIDKNPEITRFALENIRLLDQLRRFQDFYEEGERDILLDEVSKLRDQLLQSLDGKIMLHSHPKQDDQPEEAMSIREENSLHLELKNTLNELEECRRNLNSYSEENQKLNREIHDLRAMLENLKHATHDQDEDVKTIKDSLEAPTSKPVVLKGVHNETESMHATSFMNFAEEILDLQLELDVVKIILKEERSSRVEVEERAMYLNRDLDLAREKLQSVSKQYEDATYELKEVKSVVEALESQQILAINEVEELRKHNDQHVKLLSEQELEIIALKEQLFRRELRDHQFSHLADGDSTLPNKLRRMQDSLEKAKKLNTWYQNDLAFQASNEVEMDEVRRQAEAETAEVIVCMQEELSMLQQQVQDCHLKEVEAKKTTTLLEIELKELQEKLRLLTEDNKQLQELLDVKDKELRKLSEEWESLACEMEEVLVNGQDVLGDASDQLDIISSSFPHKRIWISEQVDRLIKIISEKELLIEELGKCLEDTSNKRNDVECMLKSLRGAALVINEAHQQECMEKDKEILLLKSQLRMKTSNLAELETKVKLIKHYANKASVCATVAFVVVNRMSEINHNHINELSCKDIQLNKLAEINLRKEALLDDQAAAANEAEKEVASLRTEVTELKKKQDELVQRLSKEEKRACSLAQMLKDIEDNDILETRNKLAELKTGVSAIRSHMSIYSKHDTVPERNEMPGAFLPADGNSGKSDAGEDLRADITKCCCKVGNTLSSSLCDGKDEEFRNYKDGPHRDVTIILLKKEIESALESLQEVQVEMAKLRKEKEEIWMSEKECREGIKGFSTRILEFEAIISNFEKKLDIKLLAVNQKLESFEQMVQETGTCWCKTKEFLEMEACDAKILAVQKVAEASCIFAKFEEAQDTMKEADIMINELMIANEMLKLEMERLKEMEIQLTNEKDMLIHEVQSLQSINLLKDQQFEDLEKQFGSSLMETRELVVELEEIIMHVQTTFKENFMSMVSDFNSLKGLVSNSGKLVHSCLEDVWSEIIVKDCAVSVLHLCHMGILLETITGLNAENGLLEHGLCESNSVIADLREHNSKSSRELQMCRTLKGKLLADIKNNFDRITRKEEETGKLDVKLTAFERKISDLQIQEELMLQRSNYMGSQLAILIKELDLNNRNVVESLYNQEKMLKVKEQILDSQAELFTIDMCSKDIESFILAAQLEEIACQKVIAESKYTSCGFNLESMRKELVLSEINTELQEQELVTKEAEVAVLQKTVEEAQREMDCLLPIMHECNLRITQIGETSNAFKADFEKNVADSTNMLNRELAELMETTVRMTNQIGALEVENGKLLKDLKMNKAALEEIRCHKSAVEREGINCGVVLENLKKEMILVMIQGELKEQALSAKEVEIALLQREFEEMQIKNQDILLQLDQSNLRFVEVEELNRDLGGEIQLLKDVACENNVLKNDLSEVTETKARLLNQVQALEAEREKHLEDLKTRKTDLENSSSHISVIDQENLKLRKDVCQLEISSSELQCELGRKDAELSRMGCLEEENETLKSEVLKLKTEKSLILQDLEKKNSEVESSRSCLDISDTENHKLQDRILSLETYIAGLQSDLEMRNAKVNGLLHSQSNVIADLCSISQDLPCKRNRLLGIFDEICEIIQGTSEFVKEIECLELHAKELVSDNKSLQSELLRKDEILKGLLFDLSLLQESASNTQDQKDEIEEMMSNLECLEDELAVKSGELDEVVAQNQMLEAQLREKIHMISALESDFAKARESLKMCSCENMELRAQIEEALAAKYSLEEDLVERRNLTESLEIQLSQMDKTLGQMNSTTESLKGTLDELTGERDQLHVEILSLRQELEKAQAWAEESEAVALEARQIAESRKIYAEDKEAEVKLLEISVEELECTINVLENKVDILKEEAERQRFQREELETELHAVSHHMQNVESSDSDMKRHSEEKEKDLEQALKHIQILERDITDKNAEIDQCKAHICELNLHAEAQASEFKQKFKALEAMAEQVKPEGNLSHVANASWNKSEKIAAKPRGSGSPFKCIGLGLAQQMKSEKDEELSVARIRIDELESLAVSRQKEIFALNARLASAESMTHDVIRDLLGVKLDMTNCVSLLDDKQVQKIAEKVQLSSLEPQFKEQEVIKLKQQLNEFVEERRGWLEEIDRKQAEMVATQLTLEKLRQREQLLATENEMLKMENVYHKKRLVELEGEVKKLSGQQNLQQRIHHHAKIKEENHLLKLQNEDLSAKLHRADVIISRIKEELAQYRASNGKRPYVNFDEEQRLVNKLKETEDEKMQLAQRLLGLCTSILKAAGITKSVQNITPDVAEDALEQLQNRLASSERELQDLLVKHRITAERIRLFELMPRSSPINARQDENSQTSFLSALDR